MAERKKAEENYPLARFPNEQPRRPSSAQSMDEYEDDHGQAMAHAS
jgi:hypothetical protein